MRSQGADRFSQNSGCPESFLTLYPIDRGKVKINAAVKGATRQFSFFKTFVPLRACWYQELFFLKYQKFEKQHQSKIGKSKIFAWL